jgi:hypothetical protein
VIPVCGKSTLLAVVGSLLESQLLIRDVTALAAHLSRVSGIYLDYHNTSLFRFVLQHVQEGTPTNVGYGLSEASPGETFDVQILMGDQTVGIDQFTRQLVVKVQSLVGDMLVKRRYALDGLLSAVTSPLASREMPLRPSQFSFGFSEKMRRVN